MKTTSILLASHLALAAGQSGSNPTATNGGSAWMEIPPAPANLKETCDPNLDLRQEKSMNSEGARVRACIAACEPAKDCTNGNPSENCEGWMACGILAGLDGGYGAGATGNSGDSMGSSYDEKMGSSYGGDDGKDPCASVCPTGKCDSAADAHKPECASCVACHNAAGNNGTATGNSNGAPQNSYENSYGNSGTAPQYSYGNSGTATGNSDGTAQYSMHPSNGGGGGSYGSGGPVGSNKNDALISSLKQLTSSMAMDAPTQAKVQQKIAELEAALAGCGGAAMAPSGPMQELTCGGAAGAAQQQVKFMPFDKAFGPNLQTEIAAAKASGSRVCFCR